MYDFIKCILVILHLFTVYRLTTNSIHSIGPNKGVHIYRYIYIHVYIDCVMYALCKHLFSKSMTILIINNIN